MAEVKIKLCGIYRREDAAYVNQAKPDYFGMIISFPKSHRNVSPEMARALRRLVSDDIPAVGVFVNQPVEQIAALLEEGVIQIAQLHGQESPEEIRTLQQHTGRPVWKAFKIRSREDIDSAESSPADLILLDNGYGTGQCFDWSLVGGIARPFALAGGLTPENLPRAVAELQPAVVDLSSGIETDKVKDLEKMCRAVRAVR